MDAVRKAVPFIAKIADPVQRSLFIKRVAEKLNVEQALLKSEIMKISSGQRPAAEPPIKQKPRKALHVMPDKVEMALVRLIAEFPEKLRPLLDEGVFEYVRNPELKELGLNLVRQVRDNRSFSPADLIDRIEDEALRDGLLRSLVPETPFEANMVERLFADTVDQIRKKWAKAQIKQLRLELQTAEAAGDDELRNRLAAELLLVKKRSVN